MVLRLPEIASLLIAQFRLSYLNGLALDQDKSLLDELVQDQLNLLLMCLFLEVAEQLHLVLDALCYLLDLLKLFECKQQA